VKLVCVLSVDVFYSLTTRLLSGFRQRRYYITKTVIPFSVSVVLNFYNATFADFSYTNVHRAIIVEPRIGLVPLHLGLAVLEFSGR